MRRAFFFLGLLLSVVLLVGACASTAAPLPTQQTSPSWAEFALEKYPLITQNRPMTDTELVKLGLTRTKLEQPLFIFNHYRGLCPRGQVCGKWEVLAAGTEVAQDASGRPWYKWNCSNRLFQPVGVEGPAWWPFGGGGPRWPWWLPWFLLLPLLGLLGWWLARRQQQEEQPPPPPPAGNRNGGGNGRPRVDPNLGVDPAAVRPPAVPPQSVPTPPVQSDPHAARRAALTCEVATVTAAAEAHKAEAVRLLAGLDPAGDPDEVIALLGRIATEEEAEKAVRARAAALQAELAALGPPPVASPFPPPPAPAPPAPPDEKSGLLVALRAAEKKTRVRHRAVLVAIDALEEGSMTPDEVRGWLQKFGITFS